jgi:RNA polymerase sigma factor (TIGR02999 family)
MALPEADVTTLLGLTVRGDVRAQEALYRLVENELRTRAHVQLRRGARAPDMQTTMLVNDAFLKLVGGSRVNWEDRAHFYRMAARVMRDMIVDEARRRAAVKRGGGVEPAPLDAVGEPADRTASDPSIALALHDALNTLAATNPELVAVVELHHYGGWELKQIASEILGVSYATVKRRWEKARALLYRAVLGSDDDTGLRGPRG